MRERVKYDKNIPPEMLAAIRPHVGRWAWLIPGWMQYVTIAFANDDEERTAIETEVNHEYRWATVTFYPCWLNADEETREVDVIHDFLHLSTNPLFQHARNTVRVLMGDSGEAKLYYAIEENRLRELHEGMVQDIAHAIQEKLRDAGKQKNKALRQ